jgi:hypothetical protein
MAVRIFSIARIIVKRKTNLEQIGIFTLWKCELEELARLYTESAISSLRKSKDSDLFSAPHIWVEHGVGYAHTFTARSFRGLLDPGSVHVRRRQLLG